jgi:hypothetical protein
LMNRPLPMVACSPVAAGDAGRAGASKAMEEGWGAGREGSGVGLAAIGPG